MIYSDFLAYWAMDRLKNGSNEFHIEDRRKDEVNFHPKQIRSSVRLVQVRDAERVRAGSQFQQCPSLIDKLAFLFPTIDRKYLESNSNSVCVDIFSLKPRSPFNSWSTVKDLNLHWERLKLNPLYTQDKGSKRNCNQQLFALPL